MPDRPQPDSSDPLDAGLRAAFGAPATPSGTVLEHLDRVTGGAAKLHLRDGGEGDDAAVSAGADLSVNLPPTRGNYRVLGELARGGVGIVLKGHDSDLGRDVALKVLQERHSASPEVLQRFVEEAQIGGQLQHPGIVPVYEMGLLEDSRPFFTMKLIKGRTLASMLENRPDVEDELQEFLRIFEAVCQTVAYAHSRGVIHRDLKPSNVMVGSFGEVQVVDWGLAKVIGVRVEEQAGQDDEGSELPIIETIRSAPPDGTGGSSQSVVGSVLGTPAYMSPEQALGKVRLLDERSDVFALGAVLCKILTGEPLYLGARTDVLLKAANARLEGAFERLDAAAVDRELVDLAKACLAREQGARPRNAEQVAARMRAYLTSVEERARAAQLAAAEARVRAQNERQARRLTLALALSVIAVLVVGGVGWNVVREQRTARVAAARRSVDEALARARTEVEAEEWEAVLAALDGLAGLAEGLPAAAEGQEEATRLRARAGAALETERLDTLNARLFSALEELRRPDHHEFNPPDYVAMDAEFGTAFRENGLSLEDTEFGDALALLLERRAPIELAALLDEWAHTRRMLERDAEAAVLAVLCDRLDPDPQRVALRKAMAERDFDALAGFVDTANLEHWPAPTLRLVAQALEVAGDEERLLETLVHAQKIHRQDFLTNLLLARKLVRAGRADEARSFYEVALALRPDSVETRHLFGIYLHRFADRVEDARELFQQSVDLRGDDAHLWYHLGQTHLTERNLGQAIEALQRSLELNFDYPEAHGSLAEAYLLDGDLHAAETELRTALDLAPDDDEVRVSLGAVLIVSGERGEGVRLVEDGLAGTPLNAKLHHKVGWAFAMVEEWGRAQEALEDSIEIAPTRDALDDLADARAYQGDFRGAIEACEQSLQLEPTFTGWMRRAALANEVGDLEAALDALRSALDMQWDDVIPRRMYVAILTHAELWSELEDHYAERVDRAPTAPEERNNLAWFLATHAGRRARDLDRALEHALRAVELAPESAAFWNTLALVQLRLEDWPKARDAARRIPSEGLTAELNKLIEALAELRLGASERARELYLSAAERPVGSQDPTVLELREEAHRAFGGLPE